MINPFTTTGIGSVPFLDPAEACRLIFSSCDVPFWPQLPKRSFREFMIPQYSEGMPFLRIDEKEQAVRIEKNGSDELERFYESWNEESRIAISEDYAKGLHTFIDLLKKRGGIGAVKGQITGPLTFTLGLKDSDGRPVYFDEELREISLMLLKAKARWQFEMFRPLADEVIIFIDEPILSALGSSGYMGVSAEETVRLLREVVGSIRSAGGLSGIHCCGNTDWPLVIESGPDIINFDAYDYADTIALYPEQFSRFFENGGWLAWGIIPTSEEISAQSPESIKRRFEEGLAKLSSRIPKERLLSRILLTPSCGTGSRTEEETVKIFQLLMGLKEALT